MLAYWFKVLLAAARSPVLIVVVRRRLSGSLVRLGIHNVALVATRFFIYFGNSAVWSITTELMWHMSSQSDYLTRELK